MLGDSRSKFARSSAARYRRAGTCTNDNKAVSPPPCAGSFTSRHQQTNRREKGCVGLCRQL